MTVSTTHVENTFTGDGSTTVRNFTFQVQFASDVRARKGGVIQSTDDYTVDLNADQETNPGGTLTWDTAAANGVAEKVERSCAITQEVAFTREAQLSTTNLEFVFDRLTMMLQEAAARTQGEQGEQGETGPQGEPGDITGPNSVGDGNLPVWNGTGGNLLGEIDKGNDGDVLKNVGGTLQMAASAATLPSGLVAFIDDNAAAIPTGWAHMDGSIVTINGSPYTTPDTRGKYLLCAANSDTGSSGYTGSTVRPGTVSGSKTHQHGNGGSVSINATVDTGSLSAGTTVVSPAGATSVLTAPASISMNAHSHTASISGNTQSSTEATRPIEVALLCIIKVDE